MKVEIAKCNEAFLMKFGKKTALPFANDALLIPSSPFKISCGTKHSELKAQKTCRILKLNSSFSYVNMIHYALIGPKQIE